MILSFHGADHKTGCTMLAMSAARQAAERLTEGRVLYLCCCSDGGSVFADGSCVSLESYLPFIEEGNTDYEEFVERSRWQGRLHLAKGFLFPGAGRSIHPDAAGAFLEGLKPFFSLIICDTGCELDHGFALGCLIHADQVVVNLVLRKQCLQRLALQQGYYRKLLQQPLQFVINRAGRSLLSREAAEALLPQPGSAILIKESPFGELAETEERTLLQYEDRAYARGVSSLMEPVLANLQKERTAHEDI